MAVPTITSISPVSGHSGGRQFVEIDGTNFRQPTPQSVAANGITPVAPPSVSVTFGGVPAREVRWLSPTLLYAITPVTALTGAQVKAGGQVDVVVQNLNDDGTPIGGESATLAQGYTYLLPTLTGDNESDLARCIRAFIQELERQVTPNVAWPQSTDYDDATDAAEMVAKLPSLPGLVITEVDLRDNDFYAHRGPEYVQSTDGDSFVRLAPPVTVDIVFTLAGISNNSVEIINLAAATKRFFRKNPYLILERDPTQPGLGSVQYEMDAYEDKTTKLTITANKDNLRHFVLVATVRGFDIEAMSGLPTGTGPAEGSEGVEDYGQTVPPGGVILSVAKVAPP